MQRISLLGAITRLRSDFKTVHPDVDIFEMVVTRDAFDAISDELQQTTKRAYVNLSQLRVNDIAIRKGN